MSWGLGGEPEIFSASLGANVNGNAVTVADVPGGTADEEGTGLRVAVIDIGTNSTRLLIADVDGARIDEVERRTTVTNLGRGVEHTGTICTDAVDDVCRVIGDYKARYEELGAERTMAFATSGVRDAVNGEAFLAELRERFGLEARLLSTEEEARLTFLGATIGRADAD